MGKKSKRRGGGGSGGGAKRSGAGRPASASSSAVPEIGNNSVRSSGSPSVLSTREPTTNVDDYSFKVGVFHDDSLLFESEKVSFSSYSQDGDIRTPQLWTYKYSRRSNPDQGGAMTVPKPIQEVLSRMAVPFSSPPLHLLHDALSRFTTSTTVYGLAGTSAITIANHLPYEERDSSIRRPWFGAAELPMRVFGSDLRPIGVLTLATRLDLTTGEVQVRFDDIHSNQQQRGANIAWNRLSRKDILIYLEELFTTDRSGLELQSKIELRRSAAGGVQQSNLTPAATKISSGNGLGAPRILPSANCVETFRRISNCFWDASRALDADRAFDTLFDALSLPRDLIGDHFRLMMLLWWYGLMVEIRGDDEKETKPGLLPALTLEPFVSKRASLLLKAISEDEKEVMQMKTLAMILRADILSGPQQIASSVSSVEASYRRRADVYASKMECGALPNSLQVPIQDRFEFIQVKHLFLGCISASNHRLAFLEGPPRTQNQPSDLLENDLVQNPNKFLCHSRIYLYCASVGGVSCDNCGKTSEDAGMLTLLKCRRCRLSHFCSRECGVTAWENGHKDHCKEYGVFKEDDCVILCGLRGSSHMNGMVVRVDSRVEGGRPAIGGRWKVGYRESTGALRFLSVKAKNLRHRRPFA